MFVRLIIVNWLAIDDKSTRKIRALAGDRLNDKGNAESFALFLKLKKIMIRILILFMLTICSCNSNVNKQTKDVICPNYLGYDILRIVEKPIWLPDTIGADFMGRNGHLIIKDCKGNADLYLYDENMNTILKGKFKESDIFKYRDIGGSKNDSVMINIPLIDGNWEFNNFTATRPMIWHKPWYL